MWTVIRQFTALFAIRGRLKRKVKFGQLFCKYCYSQFIRMINSFMWTCWQKFINTMLSIPVMEGIVFVYIFKAISCDFMRRSLEWVFAIRLFAVVNSLLFIRECEQVYWMRVRRLGEGSSNITYDYKKFFNRK